PPKFWASPARRWGGALAAPGCVSPSAEPVGDVVGQRAEHADRKPAPQNAHQQHAIGALDHFLIDKMGHDSLHLWPPPNDKVGTARACDCDVRHKSALFWKREFPPFIRHLGTSRPLFDYIPTTLLTT